MAISSQAADGRFLTRLWGNGTDRIARAGELHTLSGGPACHGQFTTYRLPDPDPGFYFGEPQFDLELAEMTCCCGARICNACRRPIDPLERPSPRPPCGCAFPTFGTRRIERGAPIS